MASNGYRQRPARYSEAGTVRGTRRRGKGTRYDEVQTILSCCAKSQHPGKNRDSACNQAGRVVLSDYIASLSMAVVRPIIKRPASVN